MRNNAEFIGSLSTYYSLQLPYTRYELIAQLVYVSAIINVICCYYFIVIVLAEWINKLNLKINIIYENTQNRCKSCYFVTSKVLYMRLIILNYI